MSQKSIDELPVSRPLEEWIYEGSLDEHPHVVALALNAFLWAAYDTADCRLYQVWRGGLERKAVEDGIAMKTVGFVFHNENMDSHAWIVEMDGEVIHPKTEYKGYQMEGEHVVFSYDLILPEGQRIWVKEWPEFFGRPSNDNRSGLMRQFSLGNVPVDSEVRLFLECEGLLRNNDLRSDFKFRNTFREKKIYNWGTLRDISTEAVLQAAEPTTLTMMFTYDVELEASKRN